MKVTTPKPATGPTMVRMDYAKAEEAGRTSLSGTIEKLKGKLPNQDVIAPHPLIQSQSKDVSGNNDEHCPRTYPGNELLKTLISYKYRKLC